MKAERAYEVRVGRKRFQVDGVECQAGVLTYWVDDLMVHEPVKKRVEILNVTPVQQRPRTIASAYPQPGDEVDERRRQRELRAHDDAQNQTLKNLMGDE